MAAYGLVIERGNDQAFGQLYQYYVSRLKEAEHATSPKHVDDLMGVMATDSDVFFQKVCWTNDDRENTFAHIPIFSSVSAQRFVDCLLSVHPSDQRTILTALNGRYGSGALGQELAEEREWLTEVRDQLRERANNMSPIRQYAIRNEVGRLLDPVLGDELDG